MDVARSSFYADPGQRPGDAVIIEEIRAITDEFEGYGYRRVDAELRHRGMVVNSKKVRRLMRENGLNPRRRRRTTRTTDSDHGGPIFPFIAKEFGCKRRVPGRCDRGAGARHEPRDRLHVAAQGKRRPSWRAGTNSDFASRRVHSQKAVRGMSAASNSVGILA